MRVGQRGELGTTVVGVAQSPSEVGEELVKRFRDSLSPADEEPQDPPLLAGSEGGGGQDPTEVLREGEPLSLGEASGREGPMDPKVRGKISPLDHGREPLTHGEEDSLSVRDSVPFPKVVLPSDVEGTMAAGSSDRVGTLDDEGDDRVADTTETAVAEALSQMGRFSFAHLSPSSSPGMHEIRQVSGAEPFPEAVQKMVERILVEVPSASSRREVRIELSAEVLPGTQISLYREGGRLEVRLHTTTEDVHRLLESHLPALKDRLEKLQHETVYVAVERTATGEEEHSEGRSRNRRTVWETTDET